MYLQKAQKHMRRAQELMLESQLHFGAPKKKFFERNDSQKSTIDLIFEHRKGYLVDAINHLLSASETLGKIDLSLLFPTNSYAPTLEEAQKFNKDLKDHAYFYRAFVPGSCISDVVVGILKDDEAIKPWLDKNIKPWNYTSIGKNEFLSVLTQKMHGVVCDHKTRESIDNRWINEPVRHLFADTSIELELRELLVIAISISSLAMQHVKNKCGHKDLLDTWWFKPIKTNDCSLLDHLCQEILQYNLDHMKRIGVPEDKKSKSYQPMPIHKFERNPYKKVESHDYVKTYHFDTVSSLTSMYNLASSPMNRNEAFGITYFCFPRKHWTSIFIRTCCKTNYLIETSSSYAQTYVSCWIKPQS